MKRLKHTIIWLCLIIFMYGTAQAQTSSVSSADCAVSVDIWLLGESCVIGGMKARYGEYLSAWEIKDNDSSQTLAFILLRKRLFPITIASLPTDFGWIEGQPYIDFSLVDKIDTSNVDLDSTEGSAADFKTTAAIDVSQFLDDTALYNLSQEGYQVTNPRAQVIYQYFRIGYTIRTPWPWMKLSWGVAVGYNYFDFNFYFQKADRTTRLSFFNANEEFFSAVQFLSLAVYEGESLNVMKLMVLGQDNATISSSDRNLTLGHVFTSVELLSWSFYF